ncbi:MAG TPA: NAD-dependent epimerase/dehydratase family protein [Erysipelothrix sp.]|jgi:nucleoside-diphosphate-sugar epimerase|nr:NAD-dependent epimerase/dehydratase family protein [Erysipelothrix sp.]
MNRILVTGANGQIGSELVGFLRESYGTDNVIASDISETSKTRGIYEVLDVMNYDRFLEVAKKYEVDAIIHLAALLSYKAEQNPVLAFDLNIGGLLNSLEVAKEIKAQHFSPSSIGAFGPSSPMIDTPQVTVQRPTTMYGITKVTGELLMDYYFNKFGVDTRSVRFPGLISHKTLPGGGTTDYAVACYYDALKDKKSICYLKEDTKLDMMYMPDALNAIVDLMEADSKDLIHRNAYNISSMSVTPKEFEESIQKIIPDFEMIYEIDPLRQAIADSWPEKMDIHWAQEEFNFLYFYDLDAMTQDMIDQLKKGA